MSDEYTLAVNFQRGSDDPRAAAEYEYRMRRYAERQAELAEVCEPSPVEYVCPECDKALDARELADGSVCLSCPACKTDRVVVVRV